MLHIYNIRFAFKIALCCGVAATASTAILSGGIWFTAVGMVMLGLLYAHALELMHECIHGIAFKSKFLNSLVGTILGIPTLTSFTSYRRKHLEHHRRLGSWDNVEFFNYQSLAQVSFRTLAYDLLGINHYIKFLRNYSNREYAIIRWSIPCNQEIMQRSNLYY